ncbi:MAG: hypothetical protein DI551_04000 [Micavibrio aeruginosavorus]|uniref:Uncharacterized protein n=1 Tax=Micavibrio aeruginosavorus TaxID=349221 RepID=A0A2W5PX92_9BACT|nr:MAG: hypothetical protein DI551_04000 [Micavibrio aeruginosavorus]
MAEGKYSICYGERLIGDLAGAQAIRMTKKAPWLVAQGKEGASHTFLTLKDDKGRVVQEIHGSSLDTTRGQLAGVMTSKMDEECFQTRIRASMTLFNRAVRSDESPLVKLVAIVGDGTSSMLNFLSQPDSNPHVLFEGSRGEVLQKWRKALAAAHDINKADLPFTAYSFLQPGQSCNSVTGTLMHVMGLDEKFYSPHVRMGFGRMLKDVLHTQPDPLKSEEELKSDAMENLQDYMAEADARFTAKGVKQEQLGRLL